MSVGPSKNLRKPIFGYGINDADYVVEHTVGGKKFVDPIYRKWVHMLERVFSEKRHLTHPSYEGCWIDVRWKWFSTFKEWAVNEYVPGYELDKDILIPHNKIYAPETCCFVPGKINSFIADRSRGKYPVGVSKHSTHNKYVSTCHDENQLSKYLGWYDTPEEAHEAYIVCKANVIRIVISREDLKPHINEALLRIADLIESGEYYIKHKPSTQSFSNLITNIEPIEEKA